MTKQSQNLGLVEEFKELMYEMQKTRRQIVKSILENSLPNAESVTLLRRTYGFLTDSSTTDFQRAMLSSKNEKFHVNIKDEIIGLQKDLTFLDHLNSTTNVSSSSEEGKCCNDMADLLSKTNFREILEPYHPTSALNFRQEFEDCVKILRKFTQSFDSQGRKPILITDWDGTMKDYCAQYATNFQPIYSAVSIANFANRYTRLAAVLTAGPLRGPGILDLTALPIDGPVLFSGSWGREWWIDGKRTVYDDGISEEGIVALNRLNEEMSTLVNSNEFSQFGLVGSGLQRKVDRLTLGIQTMASDVRPELSHRYREEVKERLHRVDPKEEILVFDSSTELDVEIVVHTDGITWNKANGVDRVVETVGDTLEPPGYVLICGDTHSDMPMVQKAAEKNQSGVMTIFVNMDEGLRKRVREIVPDPDRCCFVSCPDVIHSAMMELLAQDLLPIPDISGGPSNSKPENSAEKEEDN